MLRAGTFDLVLLDMEMPEMNGFEVLEHVHADRRLRDEPVIVTSSLEGLGHVVRCIEQDLAQSGFALEGRHVHATVLFSDIRDFTTLVASQPADTR